MNSFKYIRRALVSGLFFGLVAQGAQANLVTSNQPDCVGDPTSRVFTVDADTVLKCLLKGTGNINGGTGSAGDASFVDSGWTFIDNTVGTGGAHDGWLSVNDSSTSGSFAINSFAYSTYDQIAIGLKSGEGQRDPDWAIFSLADNTFSGNWSISGSQALSHAILYGRGTPTVQVPEPGSLMLLGTALGLAALVAMRRRAA